MTVPRISLALLLAPLLIPGLPTRSSAPLKVIRYHGVTLRIPAAWPVYRLGPGSHRCARFDRHAVYLGSPGDDQRCPAGVIGRTEALLIEPDQAAGARAAELGPHISGSATRWRVRAAGVEITATWGRDPRTIERAVGLRHLPAPHAATRVRSAPHAAMSSSPSQSSANSYTGTGFDACSAPSSHAMSAWSSTYHAIGIYIGGVNEACAQPNLTPDWVSQQVAAGWHLVPTYVGLQAPSNGCGCAGITPGQASAQGSAAADDAVANMQALGLATGSPIYYDMEGYSRTQANTSAVLSFLSAWTTRLHDNGYLSGVYSSVSSGITDLVNQWGTSYPEPDDIWFADWNGKQSTTSSYVPAADWSSHQRLHQYRGGHNETHGGVTINVDSDYLDGATAGNVAAPTPVPAPTLSISPAQDGTTALRMSWQQGSGLTSWLVLGGDEPGGMVQVAKIPASGGASTRFVLAGTDSYFQAEALGSGGQVLAQSNVMPTPAHLAVFGRSAFVSLSNGVGGIPAGCYAGSTCHISTTVTVGHSTAARTKSEALGAGAGGFLYFRLTASERRLLAAAAGHSQSARVALLDRSGLSATVPLKLVGFLTAGRPASRSNIPSSTLQVVGLRSFVGPGGTGGVLTACLAPTPCWATLRLASGRTVLAQTGRELIGAHGFSYVMFRLRPPGQALLKRARGNQLVAQAALTQAGNTASAQIVLTRF